MQRRIGVQQPSFLDWTRSGNGGGFSGIRWEVTGAWIDAGDGPRYDTVLCIYHTFKTLTPLMACPGQYVVDLAAWGLV